MIVPSLIAMHQMIGMVVMLMMSGVPARRFIEVARKLRARDTRGLNPAPFEKPCANNGVDAVINPREMKRLIAACTFWMSGFEAMSLLVDQSRLIRSALSIATTA